MMQMASPAPDAWDHHPLRDLVTINYGKSPQAILSVDGQVPVVGTGGVERYGQRHLFDGESVILGRKGTIDRVSYISGKFWPIDTTYYLSDFKGADVKWLYYVLQTIDFRQMNEATGVPSLSRSALYSIDVPAPPPEEQTQIAAILGTIDKAIEQTEAIIAKQQRIKTGLMQDLLTRGIDEHGNMRSEETHAFKDSALGRIPMEWAAASLSSVVDLQVGYAFKSAWFAEEGISLLRGENVGYGELNWTDRHCLPLEMAAVYSEYFLRSGDIVIGMDRTFTKQGVRISCLQDVDLPCLLVQRVGRFVPKKIPVSYMHVILQSPIYQAELMLYQKGMDIPHLSKDEILAPLIPMPSSPEELDRIADQLTRLDLITSINNNQLSKLRRHKSALMQDLLTGKVRVTPLLETGA